MNVNEFLQAFDDLKISNIQGSDLKLVFIIYDVLKQNKINYQAFLNDLYDEMNTYRHQLVSEAFRHLDTSKYGYVALDALKVKYDAARHPDVLKGLKSVEEARFEF